MPKIEIRTGIPAAAQESSFMNATLQSVWKTGTDGTKELADLAFSVAVYVGVPGHITDEDQLARYLHTIFAPLVDRAPVRVEVEIGPED